MNARHTRPFLAHIPTHPHTAMRAINAVRCKVIIAQQFAEVVRLSLFSVSIFGIVHFFSLLCSVVFRCVPSLRNTAQLFVSG